jgi:serine/threonine protein kinase
MSVPTSCPSNDGVNQFVLGKLSAEQSEAMRRHLTTCEECHSVYLYLCRQSGIARLLNLNAGSTPECDIPSVQPAKEQAKEFCPIELIDAQTDGLPESRGVSRPRAASAAHSFLAPSDGAEELGWLAHYRVVEVLGEGGMGIVFRAEDTHLRRQVALKVMKPEYAEKGGVERFLREARALAALRHEHVVTVYQVGRAGDVAYLAMEFLQGKSLARWMNGKRPNFQQMMKLAHQIAGGLAAAHAQGLIHRDIKPDNIWLEAPRGHVKILDFGLARPAADDSHITHEGDIVGTPCYMSPEQARGEPLDARSDLFSLGVVLYQLATGIIPFERRTTMATLVSLATEAAMPLECYNAALPPAFSELVLRLMAKERDDRPASAQEVLDTLDRIAREHGRAPTESSTTVGETQRPPTNETPTLVGRPREISASGRADPTPPRERPPAHHKRMSRLLFWGLLLAAGIAGGLLLLPSPTAEGPKDMSPTVPPIPPANEPGANTTSVPDRPLPVKVFLLAGQSNMGGKANISTLDWLGQCPENEHLLRRLKKEDGSWAVRDDVWVYYPRKGKPLKIGPLTVGFGEQDNMIGPELLFGHVLGDHFDNQVLLIKITEGPMSLAVESRPPGSGGGGGPFYQEMVRTVPRVLRNLKTYFPEYQHQGYELAGFVWFQGWNDMIDPDRLAEYETNLVNLVKDLRKDLQAPDMPVLIGEMGVGGDEPKMEIQLIRQAQAAAASHPEFAGRVVFVPTAQHWDEEADALLEKGFNGREWVDEEAKEQFSKRASNHGFLYLGSGKTFALIGQGFGESMKKLCPK